MTQESFYVPIDALGLVAFAHEASPTRANMQGINISNVPGEPQKLRATATNGHLMLSVSWLPCEKPDTDPAYLPGVINFTLPADICHQMLKAVARDTKWLELTRDTKKPGHDVWLLSAGAVSRAFETLKGDQTYLFVDQDQLWDQKPGKSAEAGKFGVDLELLLNIAKYLKKYRTNAYTKWTTYDAYEPLRFVGLSTGRSKTGIDVDIKGLVMPVRT